MGAASSQDGGAAATPSSAAPLAITTPPRDDSMTSPVLRPLPVSSPNPGGPSITVDAFGNMAIVDTRSSVPLTLPSAPAPPSAPPLDSSLVPPIAPPPPSGPASTLVLGSTIPTPSFGASPSAPGLSASTPLPLPPRYDRPCWKAIPNEQWTRPYAEWSPDEKLVYAACLTQEEQHVTTANAATLARHQQQTTTAHTRAVTRILDEFDRAEAAYLKDPSPQRYQELDAQRRAIAETQLIRERDQYETDRRSPPSCQFLTKSDSPTRGRVSAFQPETCTNVSAIQVSSDGASIQRCCGQPTAPPALPLPPIDTTGPAVTPRRPIPYGQDPLAATPSLQFDPCPDGYVRIGSQCVRVDLADSVRRYLDADGRSASRTGYPVLNTTFRVDLDHADQLPVMERALTDAYAELRIRPARDTERPSMNDRRQHQRGEQGPPCRDADATTPSARWTWETLPNAERPHGACPTPLPPSPRSPSTPSAPPSSRPLVGVSDERPLTDYQLYLLWSQQREPKAASWEAFAQDERSTNSTGTALTAQQAFARAIARKSVQRLEQQSRLERADRPSLLRRVPEIQALDARWNRLQQVVASRPPPATVSTVPALGRSAGEWSSRHSRSRRRVHHY